MLRRTLGRDLSVAWGIDSRCQMNVELHIHFHAYAAQDSWSAASIFRLELECQLFCVCGTGVPTFLPKWNWIAIFHLASNNDKLELAAFILLLELECRTGVPSECGSPVPV